MNVEALRDSFLAAVTDDAERGVVQCRQECDARIEEAQVEADEFVARARSAGESDSESEVGQILVSARRQAHARVLAAQRDVYDEFRREALEAAFALRNTQGYDALLRHLAESVRRELGEDAHLEVDPPEAGGVIGWAGSRRVDYSLARLVDGCIEALGERVGRLWA